MSRTADKNIKAMALAIAAKPPQQHILRALYQNYREELVAFVRKKVGAGPPEPEDVTQQAFANFAALETPQIIENPRAFLYRTANNILVNYQKREAHGRKVMTASREQEEIFGARDDLSPEIVLLEKERLHLVLRTLKAMPKRRRWFLLLHRMEGLSYAEIGRRVGVSDSTVRREVEAAVAACAEAILAAQEKTE